jgi:hypothetical protein
MRFGGLFHGFSFGAGFELMRHVIVPAILVATPLMLWWWLGPEKPTCDSTRKLAAKSAIAQAAGRIRAERGEIRRAAVLHLANDPTDFVTLELRDQLKEGGMLDLDGTPSMEKIRNLLNMRNAGTFDVEKAVAYGKDNGLDAVVVRNLDEFETVNGKAVLKGQLKFIRVAKGDVVDIPLSDTASGGGITEEVKKTMENDLAGKETASVSLTTRVFLMALCIAILPVLAFPILKRVMGRNSNAATAIALVVLLALDGLIISAALGTSGTFCGLAVFIVVFAAAFGFDLFMLSYAQLRQPPSPAP